MTSVPRFREHLRVTSTGVTLLLLLLHVAPLVLGWFYGWPWAVVGFIVVALMLTACTLYPHSRLFGSAIRQFPCTQRSVILTIDDGPCSDTEEILRLLEKHHAKAVFFLIGERAAQRVQDVKRIVAAGHLVGNHTQTHPAYWYWSFPAWRQRREIRQCQQVISSITGAPPQWFRAPVGMRNPYCNLVAAEFSLNVMGWMARGFDGVDTPVEKIVSRIRGSLSPGAIVLLHQGMPHSPDVLRRVLEMLEEDHWGTTMPAGWLSSPGSAETLQSSY